MRRFVLAVLGVLFLAATAKAKSTAETQPKPAFVRLERVTSSRASANGIEIRSRSGDPADHCITRRRAARARGPAGQLPEDASWAVLPESRTASVAVTPETIVNGRGFKTAKLHVTVRKDPLATHGDGSGRARDR